MKRFPKTQLILFAAMLFLLSPGCGKDDPIMPPDEQQLPDNQALSKIYVDGKLYREIQYDQAKRIESIHAYTDGQADGYELWKYNEENQLAQQWFANPDGSFQVAWTYEYDGDGKLHRWLVYKNLFAAATYGSTYEYNTNGRVSARHYYAPDEPDEISTYSLYEYDDNSNLLSFNGYSIQEDASVYLYAEQNYQYHNPSQIAAIREVIGNYLTENIMFLYSSYNFTNYTDDGSVSVAKTATVDIEFNADGLPVKSVIEINQTHPQPATEIITMTYEYIEL